MLYNTVDILLNKIHTKYLYDVLYSYVIYHELFHHDNIYESNNLFVKCYISLCLLHVLCYFMKVCIIHKCMLYITSQPSRCSVQGCQCQYPGSGSLPGRLIDQGSKEQHNNTHFIYLNSNARPERGRAFFRPFPQVITIIGHSVSGHVFQNWIPIQYTLF